MSNPDPKYDEIEPVVQPDSEEAQILLEEKLYQDAMDEDERIMFENIRINIDQNI